MKKTILNRQQWGWPGAWIAAAVLGLILSEVSTAWAHKMYLHAEVVGSRIQGRAYFRGGAPAQETKVEAFSPDGKKLVETKTDSAGQFSFEAPARCDYRLVVDTGDGHGAEYTLPAADLPESLPPLEKAQIPTTNSTPMTSPESPSSAERKTGDQKTSPSGSGMASPAGGLPSEMSSLSGGPQAGRPSGPDVGLPGGSPSPQQLQQWIAEAVHQQIQPLLRQMEDMHQQTRWSDILGGIGYIVGLTGMGFYLLGMRTRAANSQKPSSPSCTP